MSLQQAVQSATLRKTDLQREYFPETSIRTIDRWSDGGIIPAPVRVGRLVFWRRTDLEKWLADGCPRLKGGAA